MQRSLFALAFTLLLGATASAQGSRLTIQVEAGRVEATLRGEESVVVYLGDDRTNVRVRGQRTVTRDGAQSVQSVDVRAESVVAFGDGPDAMPRARGLPVSGIYAQGFVHVELATGATGVTVIEGEQVYLDFVNERAYARDAELRIQPKPGATNGLLSAALVVRARTLRALGADRLEAEDAHATVCTFGEPHFAIGGETLIVRSTASRPEIPAAAGITGGIGGVMAARASRPRLLDGLTRERSARGRRGDGSDALKRLARDPRRIEVEGARLEVMDTKLTVFPWLTWGTEWPIPKIRVGSSSRWGTFARVSLRDELATFESDARGTLTLTGEAGVDYYEKRGTGGEVSLEWHHDDRSGANRGLGFVRAFGINDRADEDRVGTPIRNEGRFWLRGLLRERIAPTIDGGGATPQVNVNLDGEFSRISDAGLLLEYYRSVAQTEKEQETYLNLRSSADNAALRVISKHRINDWQDQVEQLPEARLDWILAPLFTDPLLGGIYLDFASRGGYLRRMPSDGAGSSYSATRGDVRVELDYKNAFGPVQLRGYGAARETVWSERAGSDDSIDRFGAGAGWNLSLPLWRRYHTPFGVVRHAILPEAGTRHRFEITRDASELLGFDDVETLQPTDHVFLRLRTRLITDVAHVRRKVLDFSVETRYFLRDRGTEQGHTWSNILYDLRVDLGAFNLRARYEQNVERGDYDKLDVSASLSLGSDVSLTAAYRDIGDTRPVSWGARWRPDRAWAFSASQQYDLRSREWFQHKATVVRYFHRFALQVAVSHDPRQKDTSVTINLAPLFSDDHDPFFDQSPEWDLF